MHPVIRNPKTQWLYTIFSGGIYLFYWVWRLSYELNNAEEKTVLNITLWKNILFSILLLATGAFIYSKYTNNINPFAIIFATYLIFVIYVFCEIGNYIKLKDTEHCLGISFSNIKFLFLLFMIANTGVIYMQKALNLIIERERNAS